MGGVQTHLSINTLLPESTAVYCKDTPPQNDPGCSQGDKPNKQSILTPNKVYIVL